MVKGGQSEKDILATHQSRMGSISLWCFLLAFTIRQPITLGVVLCTLPALNQLPLRIHTAFIPAQVHLYLRFVKDHSRLTAGITIPLCRPAIIGLETWREIIRQWLASRVFTILC